MLQLYNIYFSVYIIKFVIKIQSIVIHEIIKSHIRVEIQYALFIVADN